MASTAGTAPVAVAPAAPAESGRRRGYLGYVLLLPAAAWLILFFVLPLYSLVATSLYDPSGSDFRGYEMTYEWSNYSNAVKDYWGPMVRALWYAGLATFFCLVLGYVLAYAIAFKAGRWKNLMLVLVIAPFFTSFLVRTLAWKLILAKEGILSWVFEKLHLTFLIDGWLALPVVGGNSLSVSPTGTFLVFVYVWLPFMILPMQAALERVPANLLEASADLGASPRQTFRNVLLPLALPGVIAGSIFTFSLTLGDYIIPQIIGTSHLFIGMAVYAHQGTAGNIPLAAAFTVVPVVIMGIYLWLAKRAGAFNAL